MHSPVGGTTGMRTESTGPSNSEIGRSSIDITSCRSRYVVSGSTRSANAVISDWKASQTTRNGILYSPASFPSACLSFSMRRTSDVFIVEFHAMLAMKIISVSIGYGSPRHALVITLCIIPCTASGYSHENALSIRTGVPSSLTNRSSGSAGQPSASPSSGWSGLTASGVFGVLAHGGIGRGNGALWRKPPGRSIVPSSVIRIASARIVWKPFECAARPRMAWKATGLPVTVSCSLPQMSVHAIGSSIFWSRAVMPISWARRRIASAGMPVMPAAHSGV